jgi:hypothetical protein
MTEVQFIAEFKNRHNTTPQTVVDNLLPKINLDISINYLIFVL